MTVESPAALEAAPTATRTRIEYDDAPSRWFLGASVVWALIALMVGAVIALQLAWPGANVHAALAYGRLRPLHTNAAIFAFVGNMIFAGVYYSTQRLVKARLPSALLSKIHFWGWQGIIVAAAISLPLGMTQAKEYAELEWPIDLAIAAVWVVFAINFFWTLARRAERHLYVAIWFYIATIVTVAVLHIVNSLAIPIAAAKSYSIFGGAQDALVQWWYGHNAVAFFLTTPILGIMYYFVPKAAGRPVYSYRLSIIHFWALVFLYIWAGPHHLLNTALPEWAQTLGMIFSLMLWAPSWGGMINGLLTLRGAWSKLRTDPVLKFFAAGLTFYGMATFEGPLLSIRSVSSLAHYTDWIVGHVHAGALGWNGFMAAGMFYWMVPRLFGTKLYSTRLADMHFWIGTVGILLYVISMWVSGVTQGLMWRAQAADGSLLYPSFVETVIAIKPLYWTRLAGGLLYLAGMIMMAYNLAKTARAGAAVNGSTEVVVPAVEPTMAWHKLVFGRPVVVSAVLIVLAIGVGTGDVLTGIAWMTVMAVVGGVTLVVTALSSRGAPADQPTWHRILEGRALVFTVLTILAVLVGGVVQLVPMVLVKPTPKEVSETRLATALEIEGRDIYLREGCYTCHSQMIRPLPFEKQRYGDPSTLSESMYDHPFQWGSKRTGPDLAREGNKNPNAWHVQHFMDPPAISEGSNMPAYPHFLDNRIDFEETEAKLRGLRLVGVPYSVDDVHGAAASARNQAAAIAKDLEEQGVTVAPDSEMVAILAYLQSLGVAPQVSQPRADSPTLARGQ
jgi:cytochrome c oxidase cbb3-type subunit I/II